MTIRTITGTVEYADGAIPQNSRLEFYLNGVHIDAVTIAHSPVYTPLDETGDITVQLYPNDTGYGADRYNVDLVTYSDSNYIKERRRVNLGKIYVEDIDGQILQDMLAVFTGPAIPLGVAQQAAQDAIDAAELAASFAGSIDPSSFAVKSENLSDLTDSDTALVNLGLTASAAELNILDGATLTTNELNHVAGVTSPIQTQLSGKQASGATLTSLEALAFVAGDIIYATAADTLARLPKGTAGQQLVMNAGATAPEWGAGGASGGAYYESTLTTWTLSATAYTFAHGLGGVPKWVTATLVCKVDDGGWAVGDELHVPNDFGGGTRGLLAGFNSTSVFVKANGAIYIPTKTTTSYITPTDTKWNIRVRAWG